MNKTMASFQIPNKQKLTQPKQRETLFHKAVKNGETLYTKITKSTKLSAAGKVVFKTSPCKITGHMNYWNPASKSYDAEFCYFPTIRLAGNYGVVGEYITKHVLPDTVAPVMATFINVTNKDDQTPVQFLKITGVDGQNETIATSIAHIFVAEMDATVEARVTGTSAEHTSLADVLAQINHLLGLFGVGAVGVEKTVGVKAKQKSRLTPTQRLVAATATNPLNVTNHNSVTGAGSRTVKITKGLTTTGVRLSYDQSTPYYNIYFNYKEGQDIPMGPVSWIMEAANVPQEQAVALIRASITHYIQNKPVSKARGAMPMASLMGVSASMPPAAAAPSPFGMQQARSPYPGLPQVAPQVRSPFPGLPQASSPFPGLPHVSPRALSPHAQPYVQPNVTLPGSVPMGGGLLPTAAASPPTGGSPLFGSPPLGSPRSPFAMP
jgi:hypothetical protein